ncbi:DEAD/DEAH box helicase family protein [Streptomyces sp. NPDC051554]|uniref:DEAD/DEAH box helicase family protein n=1 Tax=Streptomyces sp. NPDC051554 TaxID=3365656 RepID=UPI0037B2E6AB
MRVPARLSAMLSVSTTGLPPQLLAALKHTASFHNPEFYRKQNQRFSTFNTPRLVCCFDASGPDWLRLPRGLADEAAQLVSAAGGTLDITNELPELPPITAHFTGELTVIQQQAVEAMAKHPAGTLVAPPGSGKKVMSCALIAHHRVPTAVIVNRAELLTQWKERLTTFLDLGDGHVGSLGGGKDRRSHVVDLIMLQTLSDRDAPDHLLDGYGLVIMDECHAVGAPGAEAAIRTAKAPRWVGLSATPYRADQMDPVIRMQCGPIRHEIEEASTFAKHLVVHATAFTTDEPGTDGASIQAIYNELAHHADRNRLIASDIADAARRGRCSLALTNRVEHLHQLTQALKPHGVAPLVLHGGIPPADRARVRATLAAEGTGPLVLLAIDKLAGVGFDAPRLDTLFLTSPISFKGRVIQQVGRIMRNTEARKAHVEAHDYLDIDVPLLERMHHKRRRILQRRGYRTCHHEANSGRRSGTPGTAPTRPRADKTPRPTCDSSANHPGPTRSCTTPRCDPHALGAGGSAHSPVGDGASCTGRPGPRTHQPTHRALSVHRSLRPGPARSRTPPVPPTCSTTRSAHTATTARSASRALLVSVRPTTLDCSARTATAASPDPRPLHHGGGNVRRVSEYQYYEFQALDRPLSREEQDQLRAISTRARITATSFTNTYNWGDLSGNPRRMAERYFDAHLYVTNWGTHRLMLRLPKPALAPRTVQPYCLDHRVDAWTTRTHLLLDLTSEDEGGDWVEGADDSLAALIGVRDELTTGDLRSLYLAWLSALAAWELEDDDEEEYQTTSEPPVPAGLSELTAPQRALADFLRVDADLLTVAAQASPAATTEPALPTKKELAPLIAALPQKEKDTLLLRLALGPEPRLRTELLQRLRGTTTPAAAPGHRSAAHLLDAAHALRSERRQRAEHEQAEARSQHLTQLARNAEPSWQQIQAHIATKKTSAYDQAVTLLAELRDAHTHTGQDRNFQHRLTRLREDNQRRPGLIHRLDSHGLR